MTTATTPTQPPNSGRKPARLSVAKYEAMVASGAFTKADRFELIEGILVEKMTKNPPHSVVSGFCLDSLGQSLPAGWHVRKEDPVRIPNRDSEPEPDIAVVLGSARITSIAIRGHPTSLWSSRLRTPPWKTIAIWP